MLKLMGVFIKNGSPLICNYAILCYVIPPLHEIHHIFFLKSHLIIFSFLQINSNNGKLNLQREGLCSYNCFILNMQLTALELYRREMSHSII